MENVAVVFVHGIGTVDEKCMMEVCAPGLATVRPHWQIDNCATEHHHVASNNTDKRHPPIRIRCGQASGRTICLADTNWGDISLVRENIFHTMWGILVGMLGLRYFTSVALGEHTFLKKLFGVFVFLVAAVSIPLNLFTLLYALVLWYPPLQTVMAYIGSPYTAAGLYLSIAVVLSLTLTILVWWASFEVQRDRPLIRQALWGALLICIMYACFVGAIIWFGSDAADAAKSHISDYGKLLTTSRWGDYRELLVVRQLSDCSAGSKCITLNGLFLSLSYLIQVYPVWLQAALIALGTAFALVLAIKRVATKQSVAGVLLAVAAIYTVWFLYGSVLLFIVPADITANVVIRSNLILVPPESMQEYKTYWFELVPTLLFIGSMILVTVVSLLVRQASIVKARKLWGKGDIDRWRPLVKTDRKFGSLVGPRLLISYPFVALMWAIAIFIIYFTGKRLSGMPSQEYPIPWVLIAHGIFLVIIVLAVFGRAFRIGIKACLDLVNHFASPELEYPIRKRIAKRFTETVEHALKLMVAADKTHLCVIAHSQGTIITIDKIMDGYFENLLASQQVHAITIMTCGSPFTHVYQRYFPESYPSLSSRDSMNEDVKRLKRLSDDERVHWSNVYRIDDYVGTYINGSSETFPENFPLECGGHVKYWKPENFPPRCGDSVKYWKMDTFAQMDRILPQ